MIPSRVLARCPMCQEKGIRLPLGAQGTMVGKAAIKEGHQLRSLLAQDPWTCEAAGEVGPEARKEWIEGQNSPPPPLDVIPRVSKISLGLVWELVPTSPNHLVEFTEHERGSISNLGGGVISSVGSLKDSAHCYISEWRRTRKPTTATPEGMKVFKNHVGPELFPKGIEIATQGVNANSHAPRIRSPQTPYPSVRGNPVQPTKDLWRDLVKGGLFLFTTNSEDKVGPLMETKLPFVEQESMGNTAIRYICDQRLEINDRANSGRRPFLYAPTIPSPRKENFVLGT